MAGVGADGKRGKWICQRLSQKYDIVKITERTKLKSNKNISLLIDFASAESSVQSAKWCKANSVPLIIGSTGQSAKQNAEIEECSKVVPIMKCNNFSIGMQSIFNIMKQFCTENLNEIAIIETHSRTKKDAPSGTAGEIFGVLKTCTNKDIQILSERAGNGFGTHRIKFYYDNEVIEIAHTALSREVFVDGLEKCVEPAINAKIAKMCQVGEFIEK